MTTTTRDRLRIRQANASDRARLFAWANDRDTRTHSFSTEPIPWDDHCAWFARVLEDPNCRLYLVSIETGAAGDPDPVAQVRFDTRDGIAEVSVTVDPTRRGQGLASRVIRVATLQAVRDSGAGVVRAFVKPGHDASRRAFVRAGYRETGLTRHRGHDAISLEFNRV